ncbi:MAG TPA: lipase maturation factor family protein, partial [Terriglobales bacterium]
PQIAPYHLRLDWLMWFLQFSVAHTSQGIYTQGYEVWFMKLVQRLLENDGETLKLLRDNPFHETPPKLIRALFYLYRYTNSRERRQSGAWWTRQLIDIYLPPVSLSDLRRRL